MRLWLDKRKFLCKSELCFQAQLLIMRITFVVYLLILCNLVAAQRINLPAAIFAGNVDVVDQILFSGDNYSLFLYLDDMIKIAIQNHQWVILESIYKYKKLQEELFDSCANGDLAKLDDLILICPFLIAAIRHIFPPSPGLAE